MIPRLILAPPPGRAAAARLAVRRLVTGHVPATVVYAGSPEGTGILAAQRGDDPFALTTQIWTLWR